MKTEQNAINRRNFLKSLGVAGLTPILADSAMAEPNQPAQNANSNDDQPKVPNRILGKTGVEIPVLSLGCMFDVETKQIVLRKAYQWGVTYWDTANGYTNGKSEAGIGKFLEKSPELREKLFIATKASGASNPKEIEERLQTSLERMNTDYIDLYYAPHGCDKVEQLSDELRDWAADAKKRGVIKHFGFTTHGNMQEVMLAASKMPWIDAIMTSYNFRLMQDEKMQEAVDACHKAGIALIAMKVMSHGVETDEDKKFTEHFQQKGFTEGQAKLKAVLADDRICNLCIGRDNLTHLNLNVAACLDKTEIAREDMDFLAQYASDNCSRYCAGCTSICDKAMGGESRIGEVMRYLMYHNSYGDQQQQARELFAAIPSYIRQGLLTRDFSAAQAVCPQKLPIAKLMAEAAATLA